MLYKFKDLACNILLSGCKQEKKKNTNRFLLQCINIAVFHTSHVWTLLLRQAMIERLSPKSRIEAFAKAFSLLWHLQPLAIVVFEQGTGTRIAICANVKEKEKRHMNVMSS